jgi:hypothetical protein
MLDAFCLTTGYSRKYAISMLRGRQWKPRVVRKPRRRRYSKAFQNDLGVLWEAAGYICAERLQPFLPDLLQLLEKHRQLAAARDKSLAAGRQHFHHLPQPGPAPSTGALAAADPATAQPAAPRGTHPGPKLAPGGSAGVPGGRSRLPQWPLGHRRLDLHPLRHRPGDGLERVAAGHDQVPTKGPGRSGSPAPAAALPAPGSAHRASSS